MCRDMSNSQSMISEQTSLSSHVVNLSTSSGELSFKQRDKLHSLSKCLSQFVAHYKG